MSVNERRRGERVKGNRERAKEKRKEERPAAATPSAKTVLATYTEKWGHKYIQSSKASPETTDMRTNG